MAATTPQQDELEATKARETALKDSLEKAAGERDAAKAAAATAEGEAEKLKARVAELEAAKAGLEQANAKLANQVQQDGLPVLPDLPKNASQLVESVTTHSGPFTDGPDGKKVPRRLELKRGDVVLLNGKPDAVADLQAEVGKLATVFAVDNECLTELRKLSAVR